MFVRSSQIFAGVRRRKLRWKPSVKKVNSLPRTKKSLLKRIFKVKTSGVDKGEQGGGGAQPPIKLKDHPCEKMKSEEKLRGGGDDYV